MKCTLYLAASLNGLITRGETDSDWVSDADEELFAEICAQNGAILVGRKTFDQYQGSVYPVPDTTNVVLTSQNRQSQDNVYFVSDLKDAFRKFSDLGFERFMAVGGSSIAGQCMKSGIVDQLYLSIHPYIFGQGLPVFGDFSEDLNLTFHGVKAQHSEFILLDYKIS